MSTIYNGDCLEYMQTLANDSYDAVLTSPPYNMNLRIVGNKYRSRQVLKTEFSTKYNTFTDNMPIDQFYQYHTNVLRQCLRIAPLVFYNIAIVTGSKRAFFRIIGDFNEELKDIFVWDKGHGQPAMAHGVVNRQTELFLVFDRDRGISRQFETATFNRGTISDVFRFNRQSIPNHGAVMPQLLANHIVSNFIGPNKRIFDPFMGTGTTAIAALQNNCTYGGCEIDPAYIELQQQRLQQIQLKLF
jgi:site-specific DNA-methyltransferase (adenine-specific)